MTTLQTIRLRTGFVVLYLTARAIRRLPARTPYRAALVRELAGRAILLALRDQLGRATRGARSPR